MSLPQYFVKTKALPTMEEIKIGEKSTAEANKYVVEVLEGQLQQSSCKCKARAHSVEVCANSGNYASTQPQQGDTSKVSWVIFLRVVFININTCIKRRFLQL